MTNHDPLAATEASDHRIAGRTPVELRTVVRIVESSGETWKEFADVKSVSRNGAGFSLTRPCEVGRLITMVMPLDPQLRAYDHNKELYPVMGIIQYCNAAEVNGDTIYHIGVGFIGKSVPESFKQDPMQNYRIAGMTKEGLWQVVEARSQFKKRKDPRYWISLNIAITLMRQADRSVIKEETCTRNISASGLSLATRLDAAVGDKVKIACRELDFYAVALVRNVNTRKSGEPTLHVEFVESQFPIDKLIAVKTIDITEAN
jgi:hypothetical protein